MLIAVGVGWQHLYGVNSRAMEAALEASSALEELKRGAVPAMGARTRTLRTVTKNQWHEWYTDDARIAASQAMGRVYRGVADFGAVLAIGFGEGRAGMQPHIVAVARSTPTSRTLPCGAGC